VTHKELVNVKINGEKTVFDLDDFKIDITNSSAINEALANQAATFAHLSTLAASLRIQREAIEQHIKYMEAKADDTIRKNAGDKKPTEVQIKNAIILDKDVAAEYQTLLDVRGSELMMGALVAASMQKKDCLTNLGNNLRMQFDHTTKESF
jgi:hypothetical protein